MCEVREEHRTGVGALGSRWESCMDRAEAISLKLIGQKNENDVTDLPNSVGRVPKRPQKDARAQTCLLPMRVISIRCEGHKRNQS